MSLRDRAKADIEQITANTAEFAIEMTWTAPTAETCTVNGLHTRHHLAVDTDGNPVNSRKAHVSVSEKYFTDAGYPIRTSNGDVNLDGHIVVVNDSNGTPRSYQIQEWFPNEDIGLITCILTEYAAD
jgi:hypothetical protein